MDPFTNPPEFNESSPPPSPPCRRIYGPNNSRECQCHDCHIYFNPSTQRSIINVSLEDYQRVIKRFYDPDVIERGSRYRPCGRHHQSDGVTDTLTDLPTQSGLIVCSVDYVMFYGLGDSVGSKCVQVCYRYPGCQVKCEFTLKPDGKIHFYGWGACHAK